MGLDWIEGRAGGRGETLGPARCGGSGTPSVSKWQVRPWALVSATPSLVADRHPLPARSLLKLLLASALHAIRCRLRLNQKRTDAGSQGMASVRPAGRVRGRSLGRASCLPLAAAPPAHPIPWGPPSGPGGGP